MKALARVARNARTLLGAFAVWSLLGHGALAAPSTQTPIAGGSIPQFKEALPRLSVQPGGTIATFDATSTSTVAPLQISMCEFRSQILPKAAFGPTWVWGYVVGNTCPAATEVRDTYTGPVLVNLRNVATNIRFTNALPTVDQTNVLAYKLSTDQTLHWADPLGAESNMCHMASGDPPQAGVGIPAPGSECSLNFGESPRGVFNPVGIPAVPHLHGGEIPPVLDGGPDAWFTSAGGLKGHDYYTNPLVPVGPNEAVYSYPNTQSAAPLWFHDHTLGATRLNVYAGIAGGYYLLDPAQEAWFQQIQMPSVGEVIPIVLQDRMFDANGQLYFPAGFPGGPNGPPPNPQHPYWNPEFIGDVAVLNGKAWPFLEVEPRRYRFLFLNGSNARTYEMFLVNPKTKVQGPVMWAIGNDGGFLDWPSILDPNAAKPVEPHLIIMPGERYEMIIDFSGVAGQTLVLKNIAKAPFPGGMTVMGTNMGQLMQFRVKATASAPDTSYDPATARTLNLPVRPQPIVRLTDPATGTLAPGVTVAKTRALTLNEVLLPPQTAMDPVTGTTTTYPGGPVEILVNNTLWAGKPRPDFQPVTVGGLTEFVSEFPNEGETEIWEIVNTTADAHPIHTHLVTFQILNRQNYNATKYLAAYGTFFPPTANPACPGGVYCPGDGPPLPYNELSLRTGNKYGGNPDVTPFLSGAIQLPDPDEVGWKDTVMVPPGMVTRFVVRFAPTEYAANATNVGYPFSPNDGTNGSVNDSHGYVWHCHIIDHEDNEMMRQHVVSPNLGLTRTVVKGTDY
jgi:spore coat protein A